MRYFKDIQAQVHGYDDTQGDLIIKAQDQQWQEITGSWPLANPSTQAITRRTERNDLLTQTDGVVERHRDQKELGSTTSLTEPQYHEVLVYRQLLRDYPTVQGFPLTNLPALPSFLVLV